MPTLLDQFRAAAPGLMTAAQPFAASAINAVVPATPRRRAAVVVHDGYAATDAWVRARPTVFLASLAGMLVSGTALWKRKSKGAEAFALYTSAFAASTTLAWFTRPGQASPPPGTPNTQSAQMMAWLDARAASLDKSEPGWEETAMRRVTG